MENLNIRGLTQDDKQKIRVNAALAGKSMESYVRDLALSDYYELRVLRVEREFVAWKGAATEAEAMGQYNLWTAQENVDKIMLKINGEILKVWIPSDQVEK